MKVKPGYKQTEIGVIPTDWEISQLISHTSLIVDNRGKTPPYSDKDEFELIESACISFVNQAPDYSKVSKFVSAQVYKNWFRSHPLENDILFSTVGEYSGSSAIMKSKRGTIGQNIIAVRLKDVDPLFVFYWSKSNLFSFQLKQVMMNQAQPSLRVPWLLKFKFSYPQKSHEQTAIAQALSDTDELISSLDKLISKKRSIKQGAMQQLLTGKKRLPPFNKTNAGYKQTEVGLIPEDWELISFEKAFKPLRTATYSRAELTQNDETMYVHYGDIHTKYNNFLDFNKATLPSIPKSKVKNYSLLVEGDLIMVDASEDYTAINKSVEVKNIGAKKVISGLHTILLRDSENAFSNGFRGYILSCSVVKNQFDKLATGMKVYGVSKNNLNNVFIPTPSSKDEQTAIAQILCDMDSEIETLEKKRDKYKVIKQGMMQELLTGRIRLV